MAGRNPAYAVVAFVAVLFLVNIVAAQAEIPTSMVVDFDASTTDLQLSQGESGVLNLVVKNTGGQSAEDVRVRLSASGPLTLSKQYQLGTVVAGESKTITAVIKPNSQAQAGLPTVKVYITYDGYDANGDKDEDQSTYWEVPVKIIGDPMFQITPSETSFHEGAVEELVLDVMALNPANDLQATLTSDCLMVMGSSKKFLGHINADQNFQIIYEIKPTVPGACQTVLNLDYKDGFGNAASEDITLGLSIGDSGVDFKIVDVDYGLAGPGDTIPIAIILKNEGSAAAEDITLSLDLEDPFVPVDGIEQFIGDAGPGETIEAKFDAYVSWDAETKTYSVPLNIEYKLGGTKYTEEKDIGVDVTGEVVLEIINVESTSGQVRIEVANIGTRNAESVKATLSVGRSTATAENGATAQRPGMAGMNGEAGQSAATQQSSQELVEYKSSIKATKESTFTFSTSLTGTATLTLEYTGVNNERVKQVEQISVGSSSSTTSSFTGTNGFRSRSNGGSSNLIIYVAVGLVLAYLGYRYYKRKKKGEVESHGLRNLFGFL